MSNQRKRKALIGNINIEAEIFRSAMSYSDQSLAEVHELLSIWGMTPLQYNALRVLYVEDKEDIGLPSKEIGSGLTTRVPDVTRLLDRMVDKGWITRERDLVNKRVVRSRLTDIGIELVESAHSPLHELESKQLNHLSHDEKKNLSELLNKALKKPDI
ncbi:MAG: DNA-binding MarR family transcriptional regulator [Cocleimonas sp.]|jgi:DNA-binding MarR family transcriptional regulator